MPDVYLFNPEHDLALAYGKDNYTAPPFAVKLKKDLQLLPAWLAPAGSFIVVDDEAPIDACRQWLQDHRLAVEPVTVSQMATMGDCRLVPWGWNATLRKTLLKAGVSASSLLSLDGLEWVRRLSHRCVTIAVHQAVATTLGKALSPVPVERSTMQGVVDFMMSADGRQCYLKMPWSGSGHGIYHVLDPEHDVHLKRWIHGALRRQGSLLCEAALDCVQNFAVEFQCAGGQCELTGYSVFVSDSHSQYAGGLVNRSEVLHGMLQSKYPSINQVVNAVRFAIERLVAPHYDGVLGVDMMLYRTASGSLEVNPCVEINLRHTMGMVAAALGDRHHLKGVFAIAPPRAGDEWLVPAASAAQHVAVLRNAVVDSGD